MSMGTWATTLPLPSLISKNFLAKRLATTSEPFKDAIPVKERCGNSRADVGKDVPRIIANAVCTQANIEVKPNRDCHRDPFSEPTLRDSFEASAGIGAKSEPPLRREPRRDFPNTTVAGKF